jgi:hypothetical protein
LSNTFLGDAVIKLDETFFLNPPFFVSMATAAKFVQPIPIFLAYWCGCCSYQVSSISVWRVICYDHFCVFDFFCILAVSIAKVHKRNKRPKVIKKGVSINNMCIYYYGSQTFGSHCVCSVSYYSFFLPSKVCPIVAKFVQLIPIFLAYLILLDVDVVPIKFHQFLFGE